MSQLAKRLAPRTGGSHADNPTALRASRPSSFLFFLLFAVALVPSAGLAVMIFKSPTLKESLIIESRKVLSALPPILQPKASDQPKSKQQLGSASHIAAAPKDVAEPSASLPVQEGSAKTSYVMTEESPLAAQNSPSGSLAAVDEGVASLAPEELSHRDRMAWATTDYSIISALPPILQPKASDQPKSKQQLGSASQIAAAPKNVAEPSASLPVQEGSAKTSYVMTEESPLAAQNSPSGSESPADRGSFSETGASSANSKIAEEPETDSTTAETDKPPLSADTEVDGATSASAQQHEDTLVTKLDNSADPHKELVLRPEEAERVQSLMAHGHKMVDVGYFAGARAYFKRAAEAGSGEAALALGSTYDPKFIAEIGAHGIEPEPDEARFWYERARRLNAPGAEAKLARLARPADVDANSGSRTMSGNAERAAESSNGNEASDFQHARINEAQDQSQAWVEPTGAVNLRKQPSPHSEARQVITRGTKLRVMAREAGWFRVTDPATGEIGWIYSEAVETASSPAQLGSVTPVEAQDVTSR